MQEKKKPEQHKGLKHIFRKAVLTGLTAVALAGGITAQAQAQQYGGNDTSIQNVQQKPWANDSEYQRQLSNMEYSSQLRMQQLAARERADVAREETWHAQQVSRSIDQGRRAAKGGWTFGEILQTSSNSGAVETKYRSDLTTIHTNYEAARLREQDALIRAENRLDDTFAKKYGYTNSPQRVVQTTAPSRNGALSPQEQHDRLVRAYQDAQLKSAQSGGKVPMPNPSSFGLSPRDPAIQPQQ